MNCYFCQKPAEPDGSTYHHPNCAGREDSRLNNLQVHHLEVRIRELEAAAEKVHGIIAEYWGPCMGSVESLLTLREAVGERAGTWGPKVSDLPRASASETKGDSA